MVAGHSFRFGGVTAGHLAKRAPEPNADAEPAVVELDKRAGEPSPFNIGFKMC